MDWPRESTMLVLFGLYCRERLTIVDGKCWLSAGKYTQSYLVPAEYTDELIRRNWVRFDGDEWDAPLVPTFKGHIALLGWFRHAYPKVVKKLNLPGIRRYFQLRPMNRVLVTA